MYFAEIGRILQGNFHDFYLLNFYKQYIEGYTPAKIIHLQLFLLLH